MKRWNWSLLLVIICVSEIGALQNMNFNNLLNALLFGLIAGIIIGLPFAILTREPKS